MLRRADLERRFADVRNTIAGMHGHCQCQRVRVHPSSLADRYGHIFSRTSSVSYRRPVFVPDHPKFCGLFRPASSSSLVGAPLIEDVVMRGDSAQSDKAGRKVACVSPVVVSPWVNEPYPPLTELLTSHEVARLTRRPRWLLLGLMMIGRFPKKARFRGRALGWWLPDILEWMAKDLLDRHRTSLRSLRQPRQACLPLESRTRRVVTKGLRASDEA
jgi:predicted DNA-binding transcriptional regulator AlpA